MQTLQEIVRDKFFTVDYVKVGGDKRTLNGRLGVVKYLKHPENMPVMRDNGNVTMYELGKGYRSIKPSHVTLLSCRGKRYTSVQYGTDTPVYFKELK